MNAAKLALVVCTLLVVGALTTVQPEAVFEAASKPEKVTPDCLQGRLHEMMKSLRLSRPLDPRS